MQLDNKKSTFIFTAIIIVSVIFLNIISRNWFARFDLTDNKMYSLSSSSKSVVGKIDDLFTIKIYFSDQLPGQYGNNRRYLQDILEEYSAYSSGNLRFEFYVPDSDEDLAADAQKYGIQPVQLQVVENDKVEIKKVYMGLVLLYEDKRETIPVIQTSTGLEYDITTKIKQMVEDKRNVIGVASIGSNLVENQNLIQSLNERYVVQPNIALSTPVPDNIEVLLINGINDTLAVNEEKELKAYINRGGNVFIAQNHISVDIQTQQANPIQSNIFDLLQSYGLELNENLVLDNNCGQVNVQQQVGPFRMAVPMDYPFLPVIKKFNKDELMVNGLESMSLIFPSEIKSDSVYADNLVEFVPLLFTSNQSGIMSQFYNLNPDKKVNPIFNQLNLNSLVVGARSLIANQTSGTQSNIVLVSDSRFFSDQGGGSSAENRIFTMNVLDFMFGDSELISLRSREVTDRPLLSEADGVDSKVRLTWKIVNMLLPSVFVIGLGVFIMRYNRKRSEKIKAEFNE